MQAVRVGVGVEGMIVGVLEAVGVEGSVVGGSLGVGGAMVAVLVV